MKIKLIQKNISDLDYKKHLEKASQGSPDLVCLGELATSGCLYKGGEVAPYEPVLSDLSWYSFSVS